MSKEENTMKNCPDCAVRPGELHQDGCDIERCPDCGGQMLMRGVGEGYGCQCTLKFPRIPWSGEWPGVAECREYGWYCTYSIESGFTSCGPDTPGAGVDLNRLFTDCVWDPDKARFVRKSCQFGL